MAAIEGFWGVVPAGGAGTRLWPLSRAGRPKFLLDLTSSGRSLLHFLQQVFHPAVVDLCLAAAGDVKFGARNAACRGRQSRVV